jgi:hypothetical protein
VSACAASSPTQYAAAVPHVAHIDAPVKTDPGAKASNSDVQVLPSMHGMDVKSCNTCCQIKPISAFEHNGLVHATCRSCRPMVEKLLALGFGMQAVRTAMLDGSAQGAVAGTDAIAPVHQQLQVRCTLSSGTSAVYIESMFSTPAVCCTVCCIQPSAYCWVQMTCQLTLSCTPEPSFASIFVSA